MTRIKLSDDDIAWLRDVHEYESYPDMAKRFGCCVDTLKRILVREGLQDFDGAKYQVRRKSNVTFWQRPCLDCGSDESRPRMWFYCTSCRKSRGYSDE